MQTEIICKIMALNNDNKFLLLCKNTYRKSYLFYYLYKDKENLLVNACMYNKPEILEQLLKKCDPTCIIHDNSPYRDSNYVQIYYENMIDLATRMGHIKIVEMLIKDKRVDPTHHNNYPVYACCLYNYTDILNILLEDPRVNPADRNMESLIIAAFHGQSKIVNIMLSDKRVIPNDKVLQYACEGGNYQIVKKILKYEHINPNSAQNFCIQIASKKGYDKIVNLLINDIRFIKDQYSLEMAIYMSSIEGHQSVVEILISHIDVKLTHNNEYVLTVWKCRERGYHKIVELLS